MTDPPQRPLHEVVRRWETPFERNPVFLQSLSYEPDGGLTLVLVRYPDELAFTLAFRRTTEFRLMDEIGWSGEALHPDLASLYEEPLAPGRPVTTLQFSASALHESGWPDFIFQARGVADWIYGVFTDTDCIEIISPSPPEISWAHPGPLVGVR